MGRLQPQSEIEKRNKEHEPQKNRGKFMNLGCLSWFSSLLGVVSLGLNIRYEKVVGKFKFSILSWTPFSKRKLDHCDASASVESDCKFWRRDRASSPDCRQRLFVSSIAKKVRQCPVKKKINDWVFDLIMIYWCKFTFWRKREACSSNPRLLK